MAEHAIAEGDLLRFRDGLLIQVDDGTVEWNLWEGYTVTYRGRDYVAPKTEIEVLKDRVAYLEKAAKIKKAYSG